MKSEIISVVRAYVVELDYNPDNKSQLCVNKYVVPELELKKEDGFLGQGWHPIWEIFDSEEAAIKQAKLLSDETGLAFLSEVPESTPG